MTTLPTTTAISSSVNITDEVSIHFRIAKTDGEPMTLLLYFENEDGDETVRLEGDEIKTLRAALHQFEGLERRNVVIVDRDPRG